MTRTKKAVTMWAALGLTLCLSVSLLPTPAGALSYVDASQKGTLALTVQKQEGEADFAADLADGEHGIEHTGEDGKPVVDNCLDVDFYQVAAIDQSGKYTACKGFDGLAADLPRWDKETSEAAWQTLTDKAAALVTESTTPTVQKKFKAAADGTLAPVSEETDGPDGEPGADTGAKFEFPSLGIYLMVPHPATTYYYEYTAKPVLIAVPNLKKTGDDAEWLYDVSANLKLERTLRMGGFQVIKTFSADVPDAVKQAENIVFTFHVQVTPREEDKALWDGYDDLVTLHWDPNTSTTLDFTDRFPIGASVKVEEVQVSAQYGLKQVIIADGFKEFIDEDAGVVTFTILPDNVAILSVTFENTYNDTDYYSTSVINEYERVDFENTGSGWKLKEGGNA